MTVNNERLSIRVPKTISTESLTLELDGFISEDHELSNEVTNQPVEDGRIITDHQVLIPVSLKVQGVVSNIVSATSEITDSSNRVGSSTSGGDTRSKLAFDLLTEIRNRRELCAIQTNLRLYTNLALTSIRISQTNESYNILKVDLEFKEIIIVSPLVTSVTPEQISDATAAARAVTEVDKGRAETESVDGSLLFRLNNFIQGG